MKTIVIYKSNTGYTEQYANMLSEALSCDCVSLKEIGKINLGDYGTVIYGGGVRASRITGIKSIIKRVPTHDQQNLLIFAVGANGPSERNTEELRAKNLTENNVDYPLFYMQGGFDPDKLNFALKMMLNGISKNLSKKAEKDPDALSDEDKDFLNFFQEKHDNVDVKNMGQILAYMRSIF